MNGAEIKDQVYVVHVAETIRGGIATYLRNLLPRQAERYGPASVVVIIPDMHASDLGNSGGARLITFRSSPHRVISALRAWWCLVRFLAGNYSSVLHLHSTFAGAMCRLMPISRSRYGRLIYCPHGWAFVRGSPRRGGTALVERLLAIRTDNIVCVSNHERELAAEVGIPADKLTVVANGLPDVSSSEIAEQSDPSDALRIIFVGRLDRQKGFDVLLSALMLVKRRVRVDVFGASVLDSGEPLSAPEYVRFFGWQQADTIHKHLKECDVLVMPSRWEAFGLTALEAMRAGVPVLASQVGGLLELVDCGVTGWLVPSASPRALADAIESINIARAKEMGRLGRTKFLERYSIEATENKLAEVYAGSRAS